MTVMPPPNAEGRPQHSGAAAAMPGRRVPRALRQFLETEAAGGVVLLVAAVAAMLWANSPWSESYRTLWGTDLSLTLGRFVLAEDLKHWVNDGLMAVFFFVIGLEIKRELVQGDLRDPRTAAMPAIAAVGGMVVPALLFLAVNAGRAGAGGWGIPVATDIAFAIGVVALLGSRVPASLKLFLLTLAIVDDIGAIVVIALFYAGDVQPVFLAGVVILVAVRRAAARRDRVAGSLRGPGHRRLAGDAGIGHPRNHRRRGPRPAGPGGGSHRGGGGPGMGRRPGR